MYRILFCFLGILVMLTGCAAPAPAKPMIHVENAWARSTIGSPMNSSSATPETQGTLTMPGMSGSEMTSAVYFVVINEGGETDTLIGATTDVAKGAEIHETLIKNNIAEMVPILRLDVPAKGRIEFKPGGYHVMLTGLTQELNVGETLNLTLHFEKSGAIGVDVKVQ